MTKDLVEDKAREKNDVLDKDYRELKAILIDKEVHTNLKSYCDDKNLKIKGFVEDIISDNLK